MEDTKTPSHPSGHRLSRIEAVQDLRRYTANIRVAVVQEWIESRAGSEQVFEALGQLLPNADLFCLTRNPDVNIETGTRPIKTTFLDNRSMRNRRAVTLPLMPLAWHLASDSDYDLVISSSHAFARWFRPARSATHLSYVHAPLRYVWTPEVDSRGRHPVARAMSPAMKALDLRSTSWTESFAANSTEVQRRIGEHYRRSSRVIPPPVDLSRLSPRGGPRGESSRRGLLVFGRWVDYKRIDLALDAAGLVGEPITVAGRGPLEGQVREAAARQSNVTVVHSPTDVEVGRLMRTHRLLLFPGREDFGIVPIEAAACGLPVLAYKAGGASDTVRHGVTGLLFESQTAELLAELIERSRSLMWDKTSMHTHAQSFTAPFFATRVAAWITDNI